MNTTAPPKREGHTASHRSEPSHSSRIWLILAAVGATLVAVGVVLFFLFGGTDGSPTKATGPQNPAPTQPAPDPSLTSSSSAAVEEPTSPALATPTGLPDVPASSPRKLMMAGHEIGFDVALTNQVDHLIPQTTSELSRWDARGRPAHPSDASIVIVGKAQPGGALADLGETQKGAEIQIRTDTGLFTYTVTRVGRIPVAGQVDNPALADAPGRLLLIGSQYDANGDRAWEDILVTAQLTDLVRQ
ncbi:MAG TPA: hypothetical protein PKM12_02570 [Marmoricola sp.]|nr:hypothetical protein [Marmoricola sp.]